MTPRLDILPPQQRALWAELGSVPRSFVLYGGTAIAIRLGHRESVDFDFFSSDPFDAEGLRRVLPWLTQGTTVQEAPNTLTVVIQRQEMPVRVSFFGAIGTGRVGIPEITDDGVAVVASADDLLSHKLKVILQRAEGKDYQDVAALLRAGHPLDRGLAGATAMWPDFPTMQSAMALGFRSDLSESWRVDAAAGKVIDDAVARLPEMLPDVPLLARDLAESPTAAAAPLASSPPEEEREEKGDPPEL